MKPFVSDGDRKVAHVVRVAPRRSSVAGEMELARMNHAREQLLTLAATYVACGKSGSRPERLRQASDNSGIPIGLIDGAAARLERRHG